MPSLVKCPVVHPLSSDPCGGKSEMNYTWRNVTPDHQHSMIHWHFPFISLFVTFCLSVKKHFFFMSTITDRLKSFLMSVRVERGHQVDAYSLDQLLGSGVSVFVLFAQVLHEKQDHLPSHSLVSMETRREAKLWLTCREDQTRL